MSEHFKLLSEKCFNKFGYPVMNLSKRAPIKYPFFCSYYGKWFFGCDNGLWKPRHSLVLDSIATLVVQFEYNGRVYRNNKINFDDKLPTSSDPKVAKKSSHQFSSKIIEYLKQGSQLFENGIIPEKIFSPDFFYSIDLSTPTVRAPYPLTLPEKRLKHHVPILKKFPSPEFKKIMLEIASCKLKMNFPVRYFNGKKFDNFDFNNYSNPCSLFTIYDIDESDKSVDGKILSRTYKVKFDTILGYFYINNCLSAYYDLLPEHFYQLSDYAQLYYRHLILPFYNDIKGKLSLDQIRQRLLLTTKDNCMANKTVIRILDELEGNGFIKEVKTSRNKTSKSYRYSYKKASWKERKKQADSD